MNVLPMLIRREFWEHRVLVIAPVALCVVYLVLFALAGANFNVGRVYVGSAEPTSPGFLFVMHVVFTGLLYGLMSIVAFYYLCDCLYAERKDRSILFWKSLPVSDAMTVISKLVVALIAVPLVVYVLALVTNLLTLVAFKFAFQFQPPRDTSHHWTVLSWLRLNGYLLADVFVLALWFAPVAAYQLLVSVVAPRAVMVWTVLPPLALILGQYLLFDSWSIGQFVLHRLGAISIGGGRGDGVDGVIDGINALPVLLQPELWIGVAVAAVLVFATIRIRRHRDDNN
jgi:ABC-2 type transport system permease protein